MPDGQVLEFSGVTKRFGAVTAVSGLTARIEPGLVTGFLGPNGAGKTTTLRILLGLVRATEGTATVGGQPYAKLRRPLQSVGAVLESSSFHPGRTAANHLLVYAHAAGIPRSRVDEVLGLVGLADAAGRKVGGFSLGMRQRLGLAYALLGDPGVLVLDEPTNGLDPEGIRWMRGLLRALAAEGRTVLVSSHLLGEVQQTVDALLILARGRLVFSGGVEELADASDHATIVDSPDRAALAAALDGAGLSYEVLRNGLTVRAAEPLEVGTVAAGAGVVLSGLQRRGATLEDVFLDLVSGERTHPSAAGAADVAPAPESSPEATETAAEAPVAAEDDAPTDAAPAPAEGTEPPGAEEPAVVADESPAAGEADAEGAPGLETAAEAAPGTDAPAEPGTIGGEPPVVTASFAVATTGVIDIVPPADEADDDAWLADRLPAQNPEAAPAAPEPGTDDADIVSAPEAGETPVPTEDAPETHPDQPPAMSWQEEPDSPADVTEEGEQR